MGDNTEQLEQILEDRQRAIDAVAVQIDELTAKIQEVEDDRRTV